MSPLKRVSPPPLKAVCRRALLIFLSTALVGASVIAWVHHVQVVKVREGVVSGENRFVEILSHSLAQDLLLAVTDLDFLAESRVLKHFLDGPHARNQRELELGFREFANAKRYYDQIRYLDLTGMEIVRVNWGPGGSVVVPASRLQNKADRYYFKDAIVLPRGGIYISPLDLNIENDKVEEPRKPMIRLATPVFDGDGNPRGIVILNYLARRFLATLEKLTSEAHGDLMLLNDAGYWLRAPDPSLEWGFMFPDGRGKTFGNQYPSIWETIRSKPTGILDLEEGLFFFNRVHSSPEISSGPYSARLKEPYPLWIVVSRITPRKLDQLYESITDQSVLFGCVGLVALALGAWVLASTTLRRERMEWAMREREVLYRTLAEHFPNGMILLLDCAMRCVLVEGKGLTLLGLERDQVEGCEISAVFPEEARSVIETGLQEALSGREVNFELPVHQNVFQIYVVPVRGFTGEIFAEMLMTQDITERKVMEELLREAATVDGLTGLLNRRRFNEVAENMTRHARRYRTPLSLCMCDIDHFKTINDTHGHQTGDKVLTEYAELLRHTVRETDFIGRYGGDEFCILLPGTPVEDAVAVIERVRQELEATVFKTEHGETFRVSGSFGIAAFDPLSEGVTRLFETADLALYDAKRSGRNRVATFLQEPAPEVLLS